jgi:hypothetical protein
MAFAHRKNVMRHDSTSEKLDFTSKNPDIDQFLVIH